MVKFFVNVANNGHLRGLAEEFNESTNSIRKELNNLLIQVLGKEMPNAERLALAKRGLELLVGSDAQVAAMTPKKDDTDTAIVRMEVSAGFISNMFSKGLPKKIVALAKDRSAAISDIRAYSYRADFETRKIFQHVVDEKGALPSSYVNELNNLVPAKEEEFNQRTNRYSDLQVLADEIDQTFADFAKRFQIK